MNPSRKLRDKANSIHRTSELALNASSVYIGDNKLLTRLYNGQKMYLDTRDFSETPHLAIDGHWEINITRVFEAIVGEGDVVFDVGSTYGYYGLLAGHAGAATIVCVDPNPVYGDYLVKNLTVNGLIGKSHIEDVAIAGKKGKITLHLLKDDWNSATTVNLETFKENRDVPYEVESSEEVPTETVDGLVKKHGLDRIDVLKLDIEGQEEASYPAMQKTIAASTRMKMLLEFSPENYKDPKAFFAQIQSDFDYMYVMPQGDNITPVKSYEELEKAAGDNWMMVLASKEDLTDALADL